MARGFRLQPVLEVARRRLEVVTAQLQRLGAQRGEAEARLEQLQRVRAECQASRRSELAQGIEPDRLRCFDAFLTDLERSIALQNDEVARARQAWEAEYGRWHDLRGREQALSVLQHRHEAMHAARDARNEQKQQDEFTSGKARQPGEA